VEPLDALVHDTPSRLSDGTPQWGRIRPSYGLAAAPSEHFSKDMPTRHKS
jgi:hypothetical protein